MDVIVIVLLAWAGGVVMGATLAGRRYRALAALLAPQERER